MLRMTALLCFDDKDVYTNIKRSWQAGFPLRRDIVTRLKSLDDKRACLIL